MIKRQTSTRTMTQGERADFAALLRSYSYRELSRIAEHYGPRGIFADVARFAMIGDEVRGRAAALTGPTAA